MRGFNLRNNENARSIAISKRQNRLFKELSSIPDTYPHKRKPIATALVHNINNRNKRM